MNYLMIIKQPQHMKQLNLLLFFLFVWILPTIAQGHQGNKEQIKVEKIAYITTNMNFTVEEAQKFWPVYNQFENQRDAIMSQRRQYMRKCDEVAALSDTEASEILTKLVELNKQEIEMVNLYQKELTKILTNKQVLKYYQIEHNFRTHLLHKIGKQGQTGKGKK